VATNPQSWPAVTATGRSGGRSGADSAILAALAGGATAAEAARAAGVSERTVRRRQAEPSFADDLDEARRALLRTALDRLSAAATTAVDTLSILMDAEVAPSVRLGAAKAVIELGSRLRAEQELSDRLLAIEEHLDLTERGAT